MNSIKRLLGIIWAALGPLTIGGFVMRALQEIGEKPTRRKLHFLDNYHYHFYAYCAWVYDIWLLLVKRRLRPFGRISSVCLNSIGEVGCYT